MKKAMYVILAVVVLLGVFCGGAYLGKNSGVKDTEQDVSTSGGESEVPDDNDIKQFETTKIEILDQGDNVVAEDGGWYMVSNGMKLRICYVGAPEVVSVFYIPTGSQMLSQRKQLAVYSLYEEDDVRIKFESSEDDVKRVVVEVPLEGLPETGHLYVMLEDERSAVISETYNICIE